VDEALGVGKRFKTTAYGVTRKLRVVSFQAIWPEVLALTPILVVLVRDPRGKFDDKYLFTTDVNADLGWILAAFSRRWSIEVAFKSSKQDEDSISATLVSTEYRKAFAVGVVDAKHDRSVVHHRGRKLPAARAARRRFGEWDTEWSLGHMLRILRATIIETTINPSRPQKPTCVNYSTTWKLPKSRRLTDLKSAKVSRGERVIRDVAFVPAIH